MLLPQKSHTIQYLPRSGTSRFESPYEIGIFRLESLDPLRRSPRRARRSLERLYSRFRLKRATAKCRELVTKMPDELL